MLVMADKKMMALSVCVAFGLVAMLVISASQTNALSCTDAINYLAFCQQYLRGVGPNEPTVACCIGAGKLFQMASTTQTRRVLCACLKTILAPSTGVKLDRAKQLPISCNITLPFPIDPSTDCSSIS